jgi:dihydroflavonol-4-reductase
LKWDFIATFVILIFRYLMIVVTGGSGFLGAHLTGRLLSSGQQVLALHREGTSLDSCQKILDLYLSRDAQEKLLSWKACDILDPIGLVEIINSGDVVYHCAAEVSFSAKKHPLMRNVNVRGTANVVNTCLENGIRKLCYVSSIGALGDVLPGSFVNEDTPRSLRIKHAGYGWTKYLGELEVFRGVAEGLNAVVVNPSVITGPGNSHQGIGKLIGMAKTGLDYYPPGANAFVDVRDVAEAMVQLMASDVCGERFIISAENLSYNVLLDYIAEALGVGAPQKLAGRNLLNLGRMYGSIREKFNGLPNPLSKDMVRISTAMSAYDNGKFKRATGFEYRSIRQSIKDSCLFLNETD